MTKDGKYQCPDESEVQDKIYTALDSVFHNQEVVKEHRVFSDDGSGYFIDVAIPDRNIAIECKKPKNELLKFGIGQCIRYEVDGWSSYLCSYTEAITANEIKACMRADIGLIGSNRISVGNGISFDVFIQNRNRIKSGGNGYLRSRDSIRVNHILDILEVNDMEDIMNLRKHLMDVRDNLEPVRERRYKKRTNIEITLPEDNE